MPSEEGNVSSQSSSGDTKRKVSIITEPVVERLGHDNLGFEQNKRKISQVSTTTLWLLLEGYFRWNLLSPTLCKQSHSNRIIPRKDRREGKVTCTTTTLTPRPSTAVSALLEKKKCFRRSVSCNPIPIALQILDRYNGEAGGRAKKQSFSEALEKIERDYDNSRLEQSWIYSLCMRCRVEYTTPSWEPPGWQKVCPYPLCPSYRQFARILSIILIGMVVVITERWSLNRYVHVFCSPCRCTTMDNGVCHHR